MGVDAPEPTGPITVSSSPRESEKVTCESTSDGSVDGRGFDGDVWETTMGSEAFQRHARADTESRGVARLGSLPFVLGVGVSSPL